MQGGYFEFDTNKKDLVKKKNTVLKLVTTQINKDGSVNPDYFIDVANNAKLKFNALMNFIQKKVKGDGTVKNNYSIEKIFKILDNYYSTLINRTDVLEENYIILDGSNNYIYSDILEKNKPVFRDEITLSDDERDNILKPGTRDPVPIKMYKLEDFELKQILNSAGGHKTMYSVALYRDYLQDIKFNTMFLEANGNISEHLYDENEEVIPVDANEETIYNQMVLSDIIKVKIQEGYSLIKDNFLKQFRETNGSYKENNVEELCNSLFAFDNTLTILNTPIKSMYNADCIHLFLKLLHHDKRGRGTAPDLNREVRLPGDADSLSHTMREIRGLLNDTKLETHLEEIKTRLNAIADNEDNPLGYAISDISTIIPPAGGDELKNKLHKVISTINNLLVPDNNLYKVAKYDSLIDLNSKFSDIKRFTILGDIKDYIKIILYNKKKEYNDHVTIEKDLSSNAITYDTVVEALNILGFDESYKTDNKSTLQLLLTEYNKVRNIPPNEANKQLKTIGKIFELCLILKVLNKFNLLEIDRSNDIKDILEEMFRDMFRMISTTADTGAAGPGAAGAGAAAAGAAAAGPEAAERNAKVSVEAETTIDQAEIDRILELSNDEATLDTRQFFELYTYMFKLEKSFNNITAAMNNKENPLSPEEKKRAGPKKVSLQSGIKKIKTIIDKKKAQITAAAKAREQSPIIVLLSKLRGLLNLDVFKYNIIPDKEFISEIITKKVNILDFIFQVSKYIYNNDAEVKILADNFLADQCYENKILLIPGPGQEQIDFIKICDKLFEGRMNSVIETYDAYIEGKNFNFNATTKGDVSNPEDVITILKENIKDNKVGDIIKNYEIESENLVGNIKNSLKDNIDTLNKTIDRPLYKYSIDFILNLIKLLFNIYKTDTYYGQNSEGYGIGTMISYVYLIKYFSQKFIFANKRNILAKLYNIDIEEEKRAHLQGKKIIDRTLRSRFPEPPLYDDYYRGITEENFTVDSFLRDDTNFEVFGLENDIRGQGVGINYSLNSIYYNNFVAITGYQDLGYESFDDYPDCTETAIRNLINTLIYNERTNMIDPGLLPDTMIPQFKEFFEKYDLDMQREKSVYLEWRELFNNIIKEDMRNYLTQTLQGADRWTQDEFANRIWHYDRRNPLQDMRSNFINFTNVLALIMYGRGYIQNIISYKYNIPLVYGEGQIAEQDALNDNPPNIGLKTRCINLVREIIQNQLTKLHTREILTTIPEITITIQQRAPYSMDIKFLNYSFFARNGHSALESTNAGQIRLKDFNNLMTLSFKKLHKITIYSYLFVNKYIKRGVQNIIGKMFRKIHIPENFSKFRYKYISIKKLDTAQYEENERLMNKIVTQNISLYSFNHYLIRLINSNDINLDELKKLASVLKYSNNIIFEKLILIFIRCHITSNFGIYLKLQVDEELLYFGLENQYNYINIMLFDAFIEFANGYKYMDNIIFEYFLGKGDETYREKYFKFIHKIILKMKYFTLNLHNLQYIFTIFNFSNSTNSVYIADQLLCIKNIAKYYIDSNNLETFKTIIIDKIINENSSNIENLIKCISFYYTLSENNPDDLDKIIFREFIERIKIYRFVNGAYNFDILKLLENYAANILFDGGVIVESDFANMDRGAIINNLTTAFELPDSHIISTSIRNNDFRKVIYDKPILPVVKQINILKDVLSTILTEYNNDKMINISHIMEEVNHYFDNLNKSNRGVDREKYYAMLNDKYIEVTQDQLRLTHAQLQQFEERSIRISQESIINKRNIIGTILRKLCENSENPQELERMFLLEFRRTLFVEETYLNNNIIIKNALYGKENTTEEIYMNFWEHIIKLDKKQLVESIHRQITHHIQKYATYIIKEFLSTKVSQYKFYNNDDVVPRNIQDDLNKIISGILSGNMDQELKGRISNRFDFSKEYKGLTDDKKIIKILDNISHLNILKYFFPLTISEEDNTADKFILDINEVLTYLINKINSIYDMNKKLYYNFQNFYILNYYINQLTRYPILQDIYDRDPFFYEELSRSLAYFRRPTRLVPVIIGNPPTPPEAASVLELLPPRKPKIPIVHAIKISRILHERIPIAQLSRRVIDRLLAGAPGAPGGAPGAGAPPIAPPPPGAPGGAPGPALLALNAALAAVGAAAAAGPGGPAVIEGGNNKYYSKYLKYKQKYMKLKELKYKL
jgi:hypothetical protein